MKTFWGTLIAVFAIVSAFIGGRASVSCHAPTYRIDTLTVRDTIRDTVLKDMKRYVVRVDTITFEVSGDTIRDTIRLPVPIERKEYKTDRYFAIIEGFRPNLVHMETYDKTVYVTEYKLNKVKPRWGIGVQAGYGYIFEGKAKFYIGIGVQYNIITW